MEPQEGGHSASCVTGTDPDYSAQTHPHARMHKTFLCAAYSTIYCFLKQPLRIHRGQNLVATERERERLSLLSL